MKSCLVTLGLGGSMYVAICIVKGIELSLTEEMRAFWDPHWQHLNDNFEEVLMSPEHLRSLSNKMFHMWDGNHRLHAWSRIISRRFVEDMSKHACLDIYIINSKGKETLAFVETNRYIY